jgi:hypothetical protein
VQQQTVTHPADPALRPARSYLLEVLLLDEPVHQLAAAQQLADDDEVAALLKHVLHRHDRRMLHPPQDIDLLHQRVELCLYEGGGVAYLGGEQQAVLLARDLVDHRERACAELLAQLRCGGTRQGTRQGCGAAARVGNGTVYRPEKLLASSAVMDSALLTAEDS